MDPKLKEQFFSLEPISVDTLPPLIAPSIPSLSTNAPLPSPVVQPVARQQIPQAPSPMDEPMQALEAIGQRYIEQNQIPGIPLDVESGGSPWERFMLSFRREKENQIKYLQDKYGPENVRLDTDGELIIRAVDSATGQPKDIRVDERNMSAKDLIDISGSVPEIAGSIIGLRAGRGGNLGKMEGMKGVGRDIISSAIGAEAVGAAKDIGVTAYDQPLAKLPGQIPQILKERAGMAAGDVAIGGVTYPLWRVFRMIQSPFAGSRKQIQFDALEAQKYFKDKYGIDVPLTAGEATGSGLVTRTEAFTEQLPGSGAPFKNLRAQKEEQLRKLQAIMMGKSPPTDEAVGEQAIRTLRGAATTPLEEGVEAAGQAAQKGAQAEIEGLISSSTTPTRELFKTTLGGDIRSAVTAIRDAAKAESDRLFGAVRAAPGGSGKVFDASDLQARFRDILKRLPSPQQTTQVPTGILGPTGAPILRTQTGQEILKEFVPPNVLSRLQSVAALKNAEFSLSDLQQMRREVYDDIAKGEGVPGLGTHYLADIGQAITGAIEDGIKRLPSGQLKLALTAANEHYKTKVIPFNRLGITELFRRADEAGFVPDSKIVSSIFRGERAIENYRLLSSTLGAGSSQIKRLNRAIADDLLERSRLPGDELVDPVSFLKNLGNFQREYREISDNVFGKDIKPLVTAGRILKVSQEIAGRSSKVSVDELRDLLASKSPNAAKLSALVRAQAAKDAAFKNEILDGIATGTLDGSAIKPADFVNRFMSVSSPKDIKDVVDFLATNPETLSNIRTKVVEKIFRDASRTATPEDIGRMMGGDPTRIVSGTSVFKQLEEPKVREKIQSILGPEIFNDLKQYIRLEAVGESVQAFRTAGTLAAGSQISHLIRSGPMKYLGAAYKDWLAAKLLTSNVGRAWLSRGVPLYDPIAVNALITSPAFLREVAQEFPGEQGRIVASDMKRSLDTYIQNQGVQQPAQGQRPTRQTMEEFFNR